jgi:hypothetical protein
MPEEKTIRRVQRRSGKVNRRALRLASFFERKLKIFASEAWARSARQAIAIGLGKARRAGVELKPPRKGKVREKTRKRASEAYERSQEGEPISRSRSKAGIKALKKEGRSAVSRQALSRQAHSAAKRRTATERSASAQKAAKTKGPRARSEAAKKGASTRAKHR